MTSLEWYAFVGIPIILIFGGFLAERAFAHQYEAQGRSFFKTIIDGRPLQAIIPSIVIVAFALAMTKIFG